MEVVYRRDGLMVTDELHRILLHDSVEDERIDETAVMLSFDDYIRSDAASVADRTSMQGLELMGKRIRDGSDAAVFIPVCVVDCLDATS